MACAHFSRCEQACFCVVAQAAKAGSDFGKSQIDVPFDVLGEDGPWPHLVDDPLDLGHRWRGSCSPRRLPAMLKGWQG